MTMRPLLSFSHVGKRFPDGGREITVLKDVSFDVEDGAFVGLYGARRSGKSTLLRLAAGIERPDTGAVCFYGQSLQGMSGAQRGRLLRGELALMASSDWRPNPGESVVDHVAMSLGSEGTTVRDARRRAFGVLERVGLTAAYGEGPAGALSLGDRTLAMLARALVHDPRILLVDEPAVMPSLEDRERFYGLLRELTRERSMALLMASEEMGALQGARLIMSLSDGEVCAPGKPERGTVVALPLRGAAGTERPGR